MGITAKTGELLELLGHNEEPFGAFHTDAEPETGFAPRPGQPLSRELEASGQFDWKGFGERFSCVMGNIRLARKKKSAAYLSHERSGCIGGAFYTGMYAPYMEFIPHYVSTGIPGFAPRGERYMPSPAAMRAFLEEVSPEPAKATYTVFKPLSAFTGNERPDTVIFFARGEVLTGLSQLAFYTTGDAHAVVMPFGAACTNILAWPLHYQRLGQERAVLGGCDPSARKYLKTDEMTFAVPLALYQKMLEVMPESCLTGDTWEGVRKKVLRSRKTWDEDVRESTDVRKH